MRSSGVRSSIGSAQHKRIRNRVMRPLFRTATASAAFGAASAASRPSACHEPRRPRRSRRYNGSLTESLPSVLFIEACNLATHGGRPRVARSVQAVICKRNGSLCVATGTHKVSTTP